jgi:hypothetical protein
MGGSDAKEEVYTVAVISIAVAACHTLGTALLGLLLAQATACLLLPTLRHFNYAVLCWHLSCCRRCSVIFALYSNKEELTSGKKVLTLILWTCPSNMIAMTGVGALLSWGAAAAAAGAAEGAVLLALLLLLLSVSLLAAARLVRQSSWYLLLQKRQWVSSL